MYKLLTIKEICKLTFISVRTLHYYDQINLLKPKHRTNKSHRLYSEEEIIRLQQIVTLKFIGFSLSQIKCLLQENNFNILESLKIQLNYLTEERNRIEKISNFLNYFIDQHTSNKPIDWKTIVKIIQLINLKGIDAREWYKKYLTQFETHQFEKFAKKRTKKWQKLVEEIKDNIHSNPESELGASLAGKWLALANEAYEHHPELRNKLWQAYKAGGIPQNFFPYEKDVITYLMKAIKKMKGINKIL